VHSPDMGARSFGAKAGAIEGEVPEEGVTSSQHDVVMGWVKSEPANDRNPAVMETVGL
jgi:hypothetical protein